MNKAFQVVIFITALLVCLLAGDILEYFSWQAGYYSEEWLGGAPLPILATFLIKHSAAVPHLFLIPWTMFVFGHALIPKVKFWDTQLFGKRPVFVPLDRVVI